MSDKIWLPNCGEEEKCGHFQKLKNCAADGGPGHCNLAKEVELVNCEHCNAYVRSDRPQLKWKGYSGYYCSKACAASCCPSASLETRIPENE